MIHWIMSLLPKVHILIPRTHGRYTVKGTLQMWLYEGSWDGENILDYLCGFKIFTRILIRGRQEGKGQKRRRDHGIRVQRIRERFENANLLALKMAEGAISYRVWAASRGSQRRKQILPYSLQKKPGQPPPSFQPGEKDLGLLTFRTVRW